MTTKTFSQNFYLFACNSGAVNYKQYSQKYSVKMYIDDVLVRDFVPSKLNYSQYGLYDKVEGKFYGNMGTGEFTGVPVVK